jgi:hypothetical protein
MRRKRSGLVTIGRLICRFRVMRCWHRIVFSTIRSERLRGGSERILETKATLLLSEEPAKFPDALQAMDQGKPPPPFTRFASVECQADGLLQSFWYAWQHPKPGVLLLPGHPPSVEVSTNAASGKAMIGKGSSNF